MDSVAYDDWLFCKLTFCTILLLHYWRSRRILTTNDDQVWLIWFLGAHVQVFFIHWNPARKKCRVMMKKKSLKNGLLFYDEQHCKRNCPCVYSEERCQGNRPLECYVVLTSEVNCWHGFKIIYLDEHWRLLSRVPQDAVHFLGVEFLKVLWLDLSCNVEN